MNSPIPLLYKENNDELMEKRINVLHLDEEEYLLELTKIYLEYVIDRRLKVDGISDPKKAVMELKKKKYDVLIIDYCMSSMNGFELLKQIRLKKINIPVLMFSCEKNNKELINNARELGICGFIKKGRNHRQQYQEIGRIINDVVSNHNEMKQQNESEVTTQFHIEDPSRMPGLLLI